jgi:selenide,water dikinase
MQEQRPLTQFSKGSGCGCKIQPAVLTELLSGLRVGAENFDRILVGNNHNDDCSVYDLGNGQYLLQTVDFFTPMVNDGSVFGMAAAANALSDIYAMGGKPIMANAIFGWPIDELSLIEARKVLQGGHDICKQFGVPLVGGHSIDSKDPLFGLSVTGLVTAENLKVNSGAKQGDVIILTKSLGIGILAAGHKRGLNSAEQNEALYSHLTRVNSVGYELGKVAGVHSMTDVTGFGLLGHLVEICQASGLLAELSAGLIPKIEEARALAAQFVMPDNAMRNWNTYEKHCEMNSADAFAWITDPQTNGGLLLSVSEDSVSKVQEILKSNGDEFHVIGKMIEVSRDTECCVRL